MARDCQTFTHQAYGSLAGYVLVECTEHPDWARAVKEKHIADARRMAEQIADQHRATS